MASKAKTNICGRTKKKGGERKDGGGELIACSDE